MPRTYANHERTRAGKPTIERSRTGRSGNGRVGQTGIGRRIRGRDFREIRIRCGYRAGELANFLRDQEAPITTKRSVFRLEGETVVPTRYVDALRSLVGSVNFDRILEELDEEAAREEQRRKQLERERLQRSTRSS